MNDSKTLITSWTFWFGLLQIALAIVGWVSGLMDQQAALALFGTGIGTVGFRLKTSQPIGSVV